MNRTEEGLFVGAALIILTLAVLYGVQTLFVRATLSDGTPPVTASPPRTPPAPVTPIETTPALPAPVPASASRTPPPARPAASTETQTQAAIPPRPTRTAASPAPLPSATAPTATRVTATPAPTTPKASTPPPSPAAASAQVAPESATPKATAMNTPVTPPVPAPTTQARPEPAPAATPLDRGRELTRWLYGERLDEVWAAFSPTVRAEWGSLDAFRAYRAGGQQAYGAEMQVLDEQVTRDGTVTYYTRTATFERGERSRWTVIFGLDDRGRVQEFGIVGADLSLGAE
ncbi:hypothetical protein V3W47_03570 [Deinococcus sp. YIM 134068]|uniref:hypothetical protein n=1 Tax=Deinococcus lichenicola TaxID=3118910 RepID=UPI002F948F98